MPEACQFFYTQKESLGQQELLVLYSVVHCVVILLFYVDVKQKNE